MRLEERRKHNKVYKEFGLRIAHTSEAQIILKDKTYNSS